MLFCLIVIAGLIAVNFIFNQQPLLFRRGEQDNLLGSRILNPSPTAEAANTLETATQTPANDTNTVIFNDADALNLASPSQNTAKSSNLASQSD